MSEIPMKFQLELNEMNNLFCSIQDLRKFKDNYDALLKIKCSRDNLGRITGEFPWKFISDKLIDQLNEASPKKNELVSFEIDLIESQNKATVFCGAIHHVFTKKEPYWQLKYP